MDSSSPATAEDLLATMHKYWGYEQFRPLQREAMESVLEDRDSVVVMPTGGGKSLCYQVPALCKPGVAVVASPLISLMKDQVDALTACGIRAACINSTVTPAERRSIAADIRSGDTKLVYLAPERLLSERTLDFLSSVDVSFFAIDESHCISEWGHDFRPEYRMMRMLKDRFPGVGVHAYTATATERVRSDIAQQLGLVDPELLVGSFDRPNLNYRIERRKDRFAQIREVVSRHANESGIVYCIRRTDVETIAEQLNDIGIKAHPYHAGLSDEQRQQHQEDFIQERVDVVVATVAFGMGIDKSNVRYVVHAGMPKSLESYQQESGRAGRDGLEAECVLLYSSGDLVTWKRMLGDLPDSAQQAAFHSLEALDHFCIGTECRHRMLVSYFGQDLADAECEACDVCLGTVDLVEDGLILGQKILSCIVRTGERFGADHNAKVLCGSRDKRVLELGHDELSTYGLLQDQSIRAVRTWIEQLAGQRFLVKSGEFNVLKLTESGRELLRGEVTPKLTRPDADADDKPTRRKRKGDDWEGVDRGLFESLRTLRRDKAEEAGIPAYIVFGDSSLRDMARQRPSTIESFRLIKGVGDKKCQDYGEAFTQHIAQYCQAEGVEVDAMETEVIAAPRREAPKNQSPKLKDAFTLFAKGKTVDEVAAIIERANSTVQGYLQQFIKEQKVEDPTAWVTGETARRIEDAYQECGQGALRPIYEHLGEEVSYEEIRLVIACLQNRDNP
ncbi:DNA helicase RecQ [Blastopirellula marina]|uniref:DNA helicase RecQ n=1 Tax=Blastopirellula marina TaxID=124 RepID=A0A2S8EYH8_9BACT|nr:MULTISPECIES: DNA helicase RecQ [Pirellulaceae]PQO24969.1 DNA helicase RecQ [Blastopirellula marina]RCS40821.1 DNA helicase RecQ [Bremerella cremea]